MTGTPSVLLVDDTTENLLALEATLEPLGVECVSVRSGFEALREVLRRDFAAILLDVQMPDMDGLETAAIIKRRPRSQDTPIIFITGREREPTMVAKAFSVGAVDYVVKPYEPELLCSKVKALVDLYRKDAELRESEGRFRAAFEHAPIGIAILDRRGNWLDANSALEEMLGRGRAELIEAPPFDVRHLTGDHEVSELTDLMAGRQRSFTVERRLFRAAAGSFWAAISVSLVRTVDGDPLHLICQVEDVTERKAAEESLSARISFLAYHDELTGLPNRSMLREHLELALARAARHHTAVAILNLDLNRFKLVNDSLGHAAGDELLRQASSRLASAVRASDLVARVGGDEFVVLLADLEIGKERAVAELVAAAIHESLSDAFVVSEAEFYIGTSIGIALYPRAPVVGPQPDAEALMRDADEAMYEAKESGTAAVVHAGMPTEPVDRLQQMTRLRRAADNEEFTLRWLPIVDLDTERVLGVEALIRWQDAQRGLILPGEFMDLAEETGLIDRVGLWVLGEAGRQQADWIDAGLDLEIAVNISARQLWRPDAADEMLEAITSNGGRPHCFVFELRENVSQRGGEVPHRALATLRDAGVRVAIDDFAHSPLSTLQRLEVDLLKIDRVVVAAAETPAGQTMLRAVVQLARSLGIWPMGEGIETREQFEVLRAAGCRFGQGFYFSQPLPPAAVPAYTQRLMSGLGAAEGVGFEPTEPVKAHCFSRAAR